MFLFKKWKKKERKEKENKRKKMLFKRQKYNYREIITMYVNTFRENNLKIKKIDVKLNELNEIDIDITGEEK